MPLGWRPQQQHSADTVPDMATRSRPDLGDGGSLEPAQHGQHLLLLGALTWLARRAGLAIDAGGLAGDTKL